jgi:copper(I)-binding protein
MKMRPVEAIDIAPGQRIALKPGGFHLMLMGLAAPLAEGDSFPVTLTFEKAGSVEVEVKVAAAGSMHGEHAGEGTAQ